MTTKENTLEISDLWIDENQGTTIHDRAFGYVGSSVPTQDEDGEEREYCGWFFTWPTGRATCYTDEIESVVESLETDETCRHLPEIDYSLAEAKLRALLDRRAVPREEE
jgi:hypothetical protein